MVLRAGEEWKVYTECVSAFRSPNNCTRTEERTDEKKHLFLSGPLSISVSMETRREGGTGGGVAMGTDRVCMHVFVCM